MAETRKKDPWSQWYWSDWKACPEVRACSLTARGLWLEMLAIMAEAEPYGHLLINGNKVTPQQLANQAGGGVTAKQVTALLKELGDAGVYSTTDDGHIIYSRRMVRDKAKREADRENGRKGGNPRLNGGVNPPSNPSPNGRVKPPVLRGDNTSIKAQIPEARSQTEVEERSEQETLKVVVNSNPAPAAETKTPAPPIPMGGQMATSGPADVVALADRQRPKPPEDYDAVRDMPAGIARAPSIIAEKAASAQTPQGRG